MDERVKQLAKTLVEHSVKVTEGSKVIIDASDFTAKDLILECYKLCLQKGAQVYLDILGTNFQIGRADFGGFYQAFIENASEKQLVTNPEIMDYKLNWADKFIRITTIHNKSYMTSANQDRMSMWRKTYYPIFEKMINKEWVLTYFPTVGMAQNAQMSLEQFTDFYYSACNVDYKAQGDEIKRLQDILDAGKVVKIKGQGIDLTLGISGRLAAGAESGTHNVPDGECFLGPEETVTSGFVEFEYPQIYDGIEVSGIKLKFEEGRVVDFDATANKSFLEKIFSDDANNRRLGELGIGMNSMITKYMKDILFDEKIKGTVHFALGRAYESERGGGKNTGSVHWDMIKDLRHSGSTLMVDDVVVIRDGVVLV